MPEGKHVYFKTAVTSLCAALSIKLDMLSELLAVFFLAILLDYITGVIAAAMLRELSSRKGLWGIVKKVCECFVIAVAILVDWLVVKAGAQFGITLPLAGAIAAVVTVWLTVNELISVLENLSRMEVPLPSFLLKAMRLLKKQAEEKGEIHTEE